MFSQDILLTRLSVRGEVSNAKYHSSGHIYFTLKDQRGTLACVMFASHRNGLSFPLKEGQEVIVGGSVNVYERSGSYQLYAMKIEMAGKGDLYEQFERLKKEMEEKGMFSEVYKRQIPKYVKRVGIVTAPTGAAVRDIIQISQRRNPYVQLILYPAVVQGIYAADSIVRGIQSLEKQDVDVIIVGRGGGSLEDLWAFNEEKVAQAIFDCSIPTISAVGHETDTTIADYVSDLRAPTPSAGAELAVYQVRDFDRGMERYEESLRRIMMRKITIEKNRIEKYKLKLLHASPEYKIKEHRMYVAGLSDRLQMAMNRSLQNKKYSLQLYIEKLKGLSPLEKLSSGYSVATTESGVVVTDVNQLEVGDKFEVAVKNGLMKAELLEKNIVERES